MTTIEGNKIIAEFMGAKCEMIDHTKGNEDYLKSIGQTEWLIPTWTKPEGLPEEVGWAIYQLGDFQYNSSWDWLMPAAKKFDELINPLENIDYEELSDEMDLIVTRYEILPAFEHLIKCIQWYNQNKGINNERDKP